MILLKTLKTLKSLASLKSLKSLASLKALRSLIILTLFVTSCERRPVFHLHRDQISLDFPLIEMELDVVWDYRFVYDIYYDWRSEWYYGDDPNLFGGYGEEAIGYHKPDVFELRRYFTGDTQYAPHTKKKEFMVHGYQFTGEFEWGYHDLLLWNYLDPNDYDDVLSIIIDESQTLDSVFAYTHGMNRNVHVPNKAAATRAHFQPEELFSAYERGIEINRELDGFEWDEERGVWVKTLSAVLQPMTYIYLTQIILHNNDGRIVGVDGEADLSGMASSTNVNTGYTGSTPVPVNYKCNMKRHLNVEGEDVDIIGGRLLTFGLCRMNGSLVTRGPIRDEEDADRHYIDCTFLFNNGSEKSMSFDVTDQVRTRFKGGVLTVHVDVDDIDIPDKTGGSGIDAVVEEEKEETWEIPMGE